MPSNTLRALLSPGRKLPLIHVGFAFAPSIENGQEILVVGGEKAMEGDLVVCDADGWGDVRRVIGRGSDGACITAIDSYPAGRERIPGGQILGVVANPAGGRPMSRRVVAFLFPLWSRFAALRYWYRKIQEAPQFGSDASASIARKYAGQVESYKRLLPVPRAPREVEEVRRHAPPGGSILVAGCGAGREALHLAREGFRISGFDFLPEMILASQWSVREQGLMAEFFRADMTTLDLGDRRFDVAYITPLVYSFVRGRKQRIECLRRLGRHLVNDGVLIFSAHLVRGTNNLTRLTLLWLHRLARGDFESELGDWFTWFLTPEGRVASAFSRRFFSREIVSEARAAGFSSVEDLGRAHFLAKGFVR